MKKTYRILIIGILSFMGMSTATNPIDYLSIGKNIEFNDENFQLRWSSHPSPDYYKQEYLRKNDRLPEYDKMIMIEAVKGDISARQIANSKIQELERLKLSNPLVNYRQIENKSANEIIIDFILSDGGGVYEWNVYRYQNQKNETGKFLVLYAYSYRNYISKSEDITVFLSSVKELRANLIDEMAAIEIPKIKTE